VILRTVSESSTISTSGGPAAPCADSGVLTRASAFGSNIGMPARCASCTGWMISTISPLPSTVAPLIPDTRASCGPMFFTTISWLPIISSTWMAAVPWPVRSSSTAL
jgi:hypothetical protein